MPDDTDYGKKLDYDPLWQGPLQKRRSTTDFCCFIVLGVFLVIWMIVAIFAYSSGNLQNLFPPKDTERRRCGIDLDVEKKPYLIFFDMSKCTGAKCPTTQSCVKECPKTSFLYEAGADLNKIRPQLICKLGVDVDKISTSVQLDDLMKTEKCAKMYLESKSVFRRCIPTSIPDDFKTKISNETIAKMEKFVEGARFKNELFVPKFLEGLSNAKFKIVGLVVLATLISVCYLFTMRWLTKFFVYATICSLCVVIFYFIYIFAQTYSKNSNRTDALVGLIIAVVVLLAVILFTVLLWRKINVACEVIKESCKAAMALPSTLFFPLLPFFMVLMVIIFAGSIFLCLYTITTPHFTVRMVNDQCSCPANLKYDNGSMCDPKTFMDQCKIKGTNESCFDSGCRYKNSTTPGHVIFMQALNAFGFYWCTSFITAFGHMVLAGTFATWYWTYNKKFVPKYALFSFLGMTLRYHLGSLALGSLILAIAKVVSQLVKNLKQNSRERSFWLECLSCIVDAIERGLKFLTRYTYIMVAIHGRNLCSSAKESFNLLMRNIVHVVVINKITDWVLFFGIFLITALTIAITCMTSDSLAHNDKTDMETIILILSAGVGSFFISYMIVEVLKTAIDTIFICFLEDCERNDGSQEKPYFMSFKLRELLHKNPESTSV